MISSRGPNNILVLDRNGVPIKDVCDELLYRDTLSSIQNKFLITQEEIFACVDALLDLHGPSENDFIEISCYRVDGDIEVEASGLSDWVFLSAINYGISLAETEDHIRVVFAHGLEAIMVDCLTDIKLHSDSFKESPLHCMIFESFERAYGTVTMEEVDMLLGTLYNSRVIGDTLH